MVLKEVESLISQKRTVSKFEDPQPLGRDSPPHSSKQIAMGEPSSRRRQPKFSKIADVRRQRF
jgi:hypothetical protein